MSAVHEFWYETVEDTTVRQGDIFIDLMCYWLSEDLEPESPGAPVEKAAGTWIIAQASCDMESRGLDRVVFGNWVGARFSAVGPENEAVIPRFTGIHDHHVVVASDS